MPGIVMLTTNLARGGAEAQVFRLSLELKRRGWGVAVVSLLPPKSYAGALEEAGVPVFSLDMRPGTPDPRGFTRLAALFPGTMMGPCSPVLNALAFTSQRNSPFCFSGPWHG